MNLAINKKAPKAKKKINRSEIEFWSMCILPMIHIVVFCYLPLFGIIIAFKDYKFARGIFGSSWCGLDNFKVFLTSKEFIHIAWNTVYMNFILILTSTIAAILLAIFMYNLKSSLCTKVFQTMLITPNFMSWVIVSYMVFAFLNPTYGLLNRMLEALGIEGCDWYQMPEAWRFILPIANIWKGFGMGSILYYAALMGISPEIFEALEIDGGKRMHKVWYIMLPELVPILCIQTIFAIGGIFGGDFGLFYQIPRNVGVLYSVTDIIPTYIFRVMRVQGEMGVSSAAGLLQSVVGFALVLITNTVVRTIDPERSLF